MREHHVHPLALRVTLEEVFTDEVFEKINTSVDYIANGMREVIEKYNAPFRIETMGNRLCYHFTPEPVQEPLAGLVQIGFGGLFEFRHYYMWNHGILIMPYFNMLIVGPDQPQTDSDTLLEVWDDIVRIIMGG